MTQLFRLAFVGWVIIAWTASGSQASTTLGSNFDGNMSLIYFTNGNVFIENAPLPNPAVQRLLIQSSTSQFIPANLSFPVLSPPVTVNSNTSSIIDIEWSGGDFLGTGSHLGQILPSGLSPPALLSTLTIEWFPAVGSPAPGDLIHAAIPGSTQNNPILPGATPTGFFRFFDVASGQFFDPPMATGYEYSMDSASLFTAVGFPYGYGNNFSIVSSEGTVSGLNEGGYHTFTGGVSSFKVLGINPAVDATDPAAFPIFLEFSSPTGNFFTMTPIPEPATLALLGVALFGLVSAIRRR